MEQVVRYLSQNVLRQTFVLFMHFCNTNTVHIGLRY